jgi:hypothetical protein
MNCGGRAALTHDDDRGASPPQADLVQFIQMPESKRVVMRLALRDTLDPRVDSRVEKDVDRQGENKA